MESAAFVSASLYNGYRVDWMEKIITPVALEQFIFYSWLVFIHFSILVLVGLVSHGICCCLSSVHLHQHSTIIFNIR